MKSSPLFSRGIMLPKFLSRSFTFILFWSKIKSREGTPIGASHVSVICHVHHSVRDMCSEMGNLEDRSLSSTNPKRNSPTTTHINYVEKCSLAKFMLLFSWSSYFVFLARYTVDLKSILFSQIYEKIQNI